MPTLDWIGKSRVVNHHLDVPYCVLDRKYSFDEKGQHEEDNGSENMIIHGDNLLALKSLLPQYEGRIKCIYIDPPYNTGNEGWIYNDNVNDPHIKDWLNKVVGKEGEDLSRHDKWLCMMYPRLKLLHRLLAEDGAIFISIDDTEYANLKLVCDEIFGSNCFVSNISWQRTYSTRNDSKGIVNEVEHVLAYSKQPDWKPNKLPRTAEMDSKYKNPDNDVMSWTSDNPFAPGAATHQGMVYAIQHPFTGKMIYPSNSACWRYQQEEMLEIMRGWCEYELKDLNDARERAAVCGITESDVRQGVQAIVLSESLEMSSKKAQAVYDRGQWPRFYFTKKGLGGIRRKTYLDNVGGRVPTNLWQYSETGHTDEAKKEMLAIFDGKATFDTPKPHRLIEFVLKVAGSENALILDSFAGSGTTAHAVLNLNKADGGHRKFILVEMGDYADNITAERVKRVIKGYDSEDDKEELVYNEELKPSDLNNAPQMLADAKTARQVARDSGEYDSVGNPKIVDNHLQVVGKIKTTDTIVGTGGSFSYYELGEPVFDGDLLNESVSTDEIRRYVYFTETKQHLEPFRVEEPYYMGTHMDAAYYFNYEKETVTTLNRDFLHTVKTRADGYVIYADLCTLSRRELEKWHITFKKIPRDISRL